MLQWIPSFEELGTILILFALVLTDTVGTILIKMIARKL